MDAAVAWEGRFGEADLRIEIPPSGRIRAEWKTSTGTRDKVVDSIEQLERSVLFQLMVGTDVSDDVREEVVDAVALTMANMRPYPGREPAKPVRQQQRRRGGGPRQGGGPRRRGGGGGRGRRRR